MKRAAIVDVPPLTLDRRRTLPSQIAAGIRAAIQTGRVRSGDRLPASRALAQSLGVGRQVVVAAYEELAASGHLAGRIGAGSYVARLSHPRSHGAAHAAARSGRSRDRHLAAGVAGLAPGTSLHTPISSFHNAGCAAMKACIIATHRSSCTTSTRTPRARSQSSSPMNVRFSPTMTWRMPYSRIAPLHIAHGDNVVTMMLAR